MFASKNVQIHRRVQEKRLKHLGHQSGSCLRVECAYNESNQQRSLNLGGPVGTLKGEVGLSLLPTSSYQYFSSIFFVSLLYSKLSSKIPCSLLQMPHHTFSHGASTLPFFQKLSVPPPPTPASWWHPLFPPIFCFFGLVLIPQLGLKFSHQCFQVSFLSSKKDVD